jgi:uncharacterized protein (TIGR00297 family)
MGWKLRWSVDQIKLVWQSKFVLLVVLPFVAVSVVLQGHFFSEDLVQIVVWTAGLSLLLALVAWKLRAVTPGAAAAGAAITACLMFSTLNYPYWPWRTALAPVLAVAVLTYFATLLKRSKKERLGTAEKRQGRNMSQIAANLGVAALACDGQVQAWLAGKTWLSRASVVPMLLYAVGLAALVEAAADTVSSEAGQAMGGKPRLITTLRQVEPGTDGAISLTGTLAGVAAAGIVAAAGTLALRGNWTMFAVSCAGGVFGFLFDSLLGATLERRGWLNNDAVNFLSTASAAGFALVLLAILPLLRLG